MRLFFIFSLFIFSISSLCTQNLAVGQYIDLYKTVAMIEMRESKIPASITLAQGILESGSGNSRLAKQGNNHFGIKCKKDWTGCTILEDDDALQECFRCYENAEASYRDHSIFLKTNKRYSGLFELDITDYKAWAKGLLAAGYATNKKYPELLIATIERNRLTQYDSLIMSGFDPEKIIVKSNIDPVYNRVPLTVVGDNQDINDLAEANNKSAKKLAKFNDLNHHGKIEPGDVIYLRPKRRKASVATHSVKEGETMWDISQKYAIRISALYKKNLMDQGTEPVPGVVLHLQQKAIARPDTGSSPSISTPENDQQKLSETYIVKQGETMFSIAKHFNMTVEDLKHLNNLRTNQLFVGQSLKVKKTTDKSDKTAENEYTVVAGDTLYSISKKLNITVEELKKWNNLESDNLAIGQRLKWIIK